MYLWYGAQQKQFTVGVTSMNEEQEHRHHEELVSGLYEQLRPVMEHSTQGVYLYLDDTHNVFNDRLAKMLGYSSGVEMKKNAKDSPLDAFIEVKSHKIVVNAFRNAVEKMAGATLSVTLKKKSGGKIAMIMIIIPISYNGHLFALHFLH